MKISCLFLLTMVLLLSILPCQDGYAMQKTSERAEIHKSGFSNSFSAQDRESCSPFCACSCCSVADEMICVLQLSFDFDPVIFEYNTPRNLKVPLVFFAVWQPPKLA